jgi:phosphate starvation-inducible PhoH-like protein
VKALNKSKRTEQVNESVKLNFASATNQTLQLMCGSVDEHLRFLEEICHVDINRKGSCFFIEGDSKDVEKVTHYLQVIAKKATGGSLDLHHVKDVVFADAKEKRTHNFCTPKHASQQEYIEKINTHTMTFGVGPAGTGKTYLAVAQAVAAFEAGLVDKIILTRPAVEAGEHLGFLPGDLHQKIDPYLRPLFDALNDFMGIEAVNKNIAKQTIEIAPLAFMRGRTLSRAFIILDEAQNTTPMQMKMFLTRLGHSSKTVVTGDISQIDLPSHQNSGLREAIRILDGIPEISFHYFDKKDVVRHPLVARILEAYEREES